MVMTEEQANKEEYGSSYQTSSCVMSANNILIKQVEGSQTDENCFPVITTV